MGYYDGVFEGIVFFFVGFFLLLPFAVWKWVEIGIWLYHHVHIGIR